MNVVERAYTGTYRVYTVSGEQDGGQLLTRINRVESSSAVRIVRAVATCSPDRRPCFRFVTKGVDDKNYGASPPSLHYAFITLDFSPLTL